MESILAEFCYLSLLVIYNSRVIYDSSIHAVRGVAAAVAMVAAAAALLYVCIQLSWAGNMRASPGHAINHLASISSFFV